MEQAGKYMQLGECVWGKGWSVTHLSDPHLGEREADGDLGSNEAARERRLLLLEQRWEHRPPLVGVEPGEEGLLLGETARVLIRRLEIISFDSVCLRVQLMI